MRGAENSKTSPQTIMQAFRQASDLVAESSTLDDMINAYDKVVRFCSGTVACRTERSTKRDVLLYWAYDNIARAYVKKGMPSAAELYFEKALGVAHDEKQKARVLERMLDAAGAQDMRVADKCRKILRIVNQLTDIYSRRPDNSDLKRINELGEKTLSVLKKAEN